MAVPRKIHSVRQGDAYYVKIPLIIDGVPSSVLGWKFWLTVKADFADSDGAALIQKSTDAGTILPLDITSVYAVGLPADTKGKEPGRYIGDIQGKSPSGDPHTLEPFVFEITPEVTLSV